MHGAKSGHLLVYCDAKILLIDFNILGDKTYSFFIDEQLCEIVIELIKGQFYYSFEINKKADTPRNNLRRKIERRHLLQGLMFFGVVLILGISFSLLLLNWNNKRSYEKLQSGIHQHGLESVAKILKVSSSEIKYFYIVNGQSYSSESGLEEQSVLVSENGMPIQEGDEFVLTYVSTNPKVSEIDYSRPTPEQIDKYRSMTIDKHLQLNPQKDLKQAACMVDIAYEIKGIKGFADFYFQNTPESENPQNNNLTYKRLIRDLPFQKKFDERCWN